MAQRAAEHVRLHLVLEYRFPVREDKRLRDYDARVKEAEAEGTPPSSVRTYDEIRRDISERLIAQAVAAVYGDNVPRAERKCYRRVQEQLIDDAHGLELDGATFDWLRATLMHDKVKVPPTDVSWHETLIEALDTVERTAPAPVSE